MSCALSYILHVFVWWFRLFFVQLNIRATSAERAIVARHQTGRQRQTTKCVLLLTHVDLFRSLRMALTLVRTMQPRGANVICVRLHKRSLSLHDDREQYRTTTKLLLQTE